MKLPLATRSVAPKAEAHYFLLVSTYSQKSLGGAGHTRLDDCMCLFLPLSLWKDWTFTTTHFYNIYLMTDKLNKKLTTTWMRTRRSCAKTIFQSVVLSEYLNSFHLSQTNSWNKEKQSTNANMAWNTPWVCYWYKQLQSSDSISLQKSVQTFIILRCRRDKSFIQSPMTRSNFQRSHFDFTETCRSS